MDKKEEVVLNIARCCSTLIQNIAYLQNYAMIRIINPPMAKYNFDGIHKYNKRGMKELDRLIKEVDLDYEHTKKIRRKLDTPLS
jgi:hypothetical protein